MRVPCFWGRGVFVMFLSYVLSCVCVSQVLFLALFRIVSGGASFFPPSICSAKFVTLCCVPMFGGNMREANKAKTKPLSTSDRKHSKSYLYFFFVRSLPNRICDMNRNSGNKSFIR